MLFVYIINILYIWILLVSVRFGFGSVWYFVYRNIETTQVFESFLSDSGFGYLGSVMVWSFGFFLARPSFDDHFGYKLLLAIVAST